MTRDCHIYMEYTCTHQLGKILIHQNLYSTPPRATLHDNINTDDCSEDMGEEKRGRIQGGGVEQEKGRRSEGEGRAKGRQKEGEMEGRGIEVRKVEGLIDARTLKKRCALAAVTVVQQAYNCRRGGLMFDNQHI